MWHWSHHCCTWWLLFFTISYHESLPALTGANPQIKWNVLMHNWGQSWREQLAGFKTAPHVHRFAICAAVPVQCAVWAASLCIFSPSKSLMRPCSAPHWLGWAVEVRTDAWWPMTSPKRHRLCHVWARQPPWASAPLGCKQPSASPRSGDIRRPMERVGEDMRDTAACTAHLPLKYCQMDSWKHSGL